MDSINSMSKSLPLQLPTEEPRVGSSKDSSQAGAGVDIGQGPPALVTLTDKVSPAPHNGREHLEPSKTAREEYLSTTRSLLDVEDQKTVHRSPGSASHAGPNKLLKVGDNSEGGVLLPGIIDLSATAAKLSATAVADGRSLKAPLSTSIAEETATKSAPSKQEVTGNAITLENPEHLPPHLRWLKGKDAETVKRVLSQSPTLQAPAVVPSGVSLPGPRAKDSAEKVSRPSQTVAEKSRLKEQARLDDRTGVAKPKVSKAKGEAATKHEASKKDVLLAVKVEKRFPCPIQECPAGFHVEKELGKHMNDRHQYCKKCKLWLADDDMLHIHKVESEQHIICEICSVEFYTSEALDAHMKQNHALDQEIPCYGCGKRFVRAAGIVDHIEKGHCKSISPERLHLQRAAKTSEFFLAKSIPSGPEKARAIESKAAAPKRLLIQHDAFEDDQDQATKGAIHPLLPELPVMSEIAKGKSRQVSDLDEWPALGRGIDLLGSEISIVNESMPRKVRIPTAAGAKFPPEARRVDDPKNLLRVPLEDRCTFKNAAGQIVFDPHDPDTDCERFKNYDNKYKCYVAVCGKSFATEAGFRAHLTSQVHQGLTYTCHSCLKTFSSATALTSHLESASTRCSVKESMDYASTMGMASGGLVNVHGFDKKGNVIFGGASEQEKGVLMLESNYNTRW